MEDLEKLRKKLARTVTGTVATHGLLGDGDRVMVCLSGGKDSYTMLDLLWRARQRAPYRFELIAVHLDQVQPGYDGTHLVRWLEGFGAPFEILREDTYSVVRELTRDGGTPCAPCSRFRRGILYTAAERLGCNKLALGHHREDALETFLMNLVFRGSLEAMPPIYTTDDGRFQVIRPLLECDEHDIAAYAAAVGFPIIPCNLCGSIGGLKRDAMGRVLDTLEAHNPHVRSVMMRALGNVKPSHLLDRGLADLWAAQRPQRGDAEEERCGLRFAALPVERASE